MKANADSWDLPRGCVGTLTILLFLPIGVSASMAQQEASGVATAAPASANAPPADSRQEKPATPPDAKSEKKPGSESKPDQQGKDAAGEKPSEPEVVKRPSSPPEPFDPRQFQLTPDQDGKVRFAFVGAPWPDLLRWFARVSGRSLDWQELPADYLNLVTERTYTIEEAQDVINRHLLTRGFTLLNAPETLMVVNIKKLDAALVPRVEPDELDDRSPHEFVKVSFELDWLPAETAVKELQPMMSPNGKLSALSATNRLEAMDAVINLREIHKVLVREQTPAEDNRLVRVFKLKYTRAADVLEQLKGLLGLKSEKPSVPMNPEQMAQMQRQMQQMAQQQQQQGGQQAPAAKDSKEDVHLVVNVRDNSILAQAPPDQMAIIVQAVEAIDVEPERTPLLRNLEGVRVYRLNAINPETLVKLIEKTGELSPNAQLEVDEKHKALIAFGTAVDHLTISMLVEKLDGSNRRFEVIALKKLPADYVAGTIQRMLGGEDDENRDSGRRRYYYFYDPFGRRESDQTSTDKFRVDADVEFNRLLVWANEIELEEVENLLIKLGEIPPRGGNRNTIRMIDAMPGEEAEKLLEHIRRLWPSIAPNPLLLPGAEAPQKPQEPDAAPDTEAPNEKSASEVRDEVARRPVSVPVSLTQPAHQTLAMADAIDEPPVRSEPLEEQPTANIDLPNRPTAGVLSDSRDPSPVSITRSPNGGLIVTSQDTRALDRLEEIVQHLIPPHRDYKVFKLKYPTTWAWGVALNLEDFFKEDEEKKSGYDPWYDYVYGSSSSSDSRRLSKRRPLKFIADSDSNTIVVQGATPEQLTIIEELIELYDQPPDADPKSVRKQEIFHIRYSKAEVIAKVLKDVYRDLLSSNDPALQQNQQQQQQRDQGTQSEERRVTYIYGGMADQDEKQPEAPIRFKGLISVGVDDVSNIVVVSAPERLLEGIRPMIETLDEAAKPPATVMRVVPSNGTRIDRAVLEALVHHAATGKPLVETPQQAAQPEQPGSPQQPESQQRQNQRRRPSSDSESEAPVTVRAYY